MAAEKEEGERSSLVNPSGGGLSCMALINLLSELNRSTSAANRSASAVDYFASAAIIADSDLL